MPLFTDKDRLRYASVGQEVVTKYDDTGTGIRCMVVSVNGKSIYIENEKRDFRKILDVSELYPYDERVKAYARSLKVVKPDIKEITKTIEASNVSSDFAEMVERMMFVQA